MIDKLASVMTVDDLAAMASEEGVTVRAVLKKLAEGLESKTVGRVDNNGNIIEATIQADMPTQHKFMQSAAEVLRLVRKDTEQQIATVEHRMAPEDITRLEGIAKELKGLECRLAADPTQQGIIDVEIKA